MSRDVVELAAKMYKCHDTAKTLCGGEFATKVQVYIDILRNYEKTHRCETLEAALAIGKDPRISGSGWQLMMILAAAVEIIEPSI